MHNSTADHNVRARDDHQKKTTEKCIFHIHSGSKALSHYSLAQFIFTSRTVQTSRARARAPNKCTEARDNKSRGIPACARSACVRRCSLPTPRRLADVRANINHMCVQRAIHAARRGQRASALAQIGRPIPVNIIISIPWHATERVIAATQRCRNAVKCACARALRAAGRRPCDRADDRDVL